MNEERQIEVRRGQVQLIDLAANNERVASNSDSAIKSIHLSLTALGKQMNPALFFPPLCLCLYLYHFQFYR